ncbi:MAG: hypothetical protein R6X12_01390 [bacterium]
MAGCGAFVTAARLTRTALLLAAVLGATACEVPSVTEPVYLPLAVGNRWVYEEREDGESSGVAVIEVVAREEPGFRLGVEADSSRSAHVRSVDSTLYLRPAGRNEWRTMLSDDPARRCTEVMLVGTGGDYRSEYIGWFSSGANHYRDCQALQCRSSGFAFLFGWSNWRHEVYAPSVGLVYYADSTGFWSFFFGSSWSRTEWFLRDRSIADR